MFHDEMKLDLCHDVAGGACFLGFNVRDGNEACFSILFYFLPIRVYFLSYEVLMVCIKTEMVLPSKFRPKFDGTARQHQLQIDMCSYN